MNDKPAFPLPEPIARIAGVKFPDMPVSGLTRRELFAAMAMQGAAHQIKWGDRYSHWAEQAVKLADALITELDKE